MQAPSVCSPVTVSLLTQPPTVLSTWSLVRSRMTMQNRQVQHLRGLKQQRLISCLCCLSTTGQPRHALTLTFRTLACWRLCPPVSSQLAQGLRTAWQMEPEQACTLLTLTSGVSNRCPPCYYHKQFLERTYTHSCKNRCLLHHLHTQLILTTHGVQAFTTFHT